MAIKTNKVPGRFPRPPGPKNKVFENPPRPAPTGPERGESRLAARLLELKSSAEIEAEKNTNSAKFEAELQKQVSIQGDTTAGMPLKHS